MPTGCEAIKYGFRYGPAEVTRLHSGDDGSVFLEIKTDRRCMQLYVTPKGLIRVAKIEKI